MNTAQITHSYRNVLKCSKAPAESVRHRTIKFWLMLYCLDNKLSFDTEVTFRSGGRADFYVREWDLAIEVLHTEDLKKFQSKNYPCKTLPISTDIDQMALSVMMADLQQTNGEGYDYYCRRYTNNKSKNLNSGGNQDER